MQPNSGLPSATSHGRACRRRPKERMRGRKMADAAREEAGPIFLVLPIVHKTPKASFLATVFRQALTV